MAYCTLKNVVIFVFALSFVFHPYLTAYQDFDPKKLDTYIKKSMESWEVPGMAIAVVQNGNISFINGYGIASVETKEPVDKDTIFSIASCTKAFTAAALVMLQEEKKLSLDDKVCSLLKDFQLSNPYATQELTLRDLCLHRSGIGMPDLLLWYETPLDRKEILEKVRYLPLLQGFRNQFQYSNLMYIALGEIIPSVTSISWDSFIHERFFVPLEMKRSFTSNSLVKGKPNVASPHQKIDGILKTVYITNTDNEGPAASIHSSVSDMSRWIQMLLQGGVYKEKRIFNKNSIEQIFTPQICVTNDLCKTFRPPEVKFLSYGLGWYCYNYHGATVVEHTGCIDGMGALVLMVPEKNLGIVILTNRLLNGLPFSIANHLLDSLFGLPERNWNDLLHQTSIDFEKLRENENKNAEREHVLNTLPSLTLKEYEGNYTNDFGVARISLQNGDLFLDLLGFHYPLTHWHFDTFQFDPHDRFPLLPKTTITFTVNRSGKVANFKLVSYPWIEDKWEKEPTKE